MSGRTSSSFVHRAHVFRLSAGTSGRKSSIDGQGPDELFGGYNRHLGVYYGDWWRSLPRPIRSSLGLAVSRLPRNETLKRGIYSLGVDDRLRRYQHVFSIAPEKQINGLFRDDVLPE